MIINMMKKIFSIVFILISLFGCIKDNNIKIEAIRNKNIDSEILDDFDYYNNKLAKYFLLKSNIDFKIVENSTSNLGYIIILSNRQKFFLNGVYTEIDFIKKIEQLPIEILKNGKPINPQNSNGSYINIGKYTTRAEAQKANSGSVNVNRK